ncbi:hypothetical protein GA0115240_119034, partial [Streptomyces sp. DvalAA-14]
MQPSPHTAAPVEPQPQPHRRARGTRRIALITAAGV